MSPAFDRLAALVRTDDPAAAEVAGLVLSLVDGLLVDVRRIATSLERIAGCERDGYFDVTRHEP